MSTALMTFFFFVGVTFAEEATHLCKLEEVLYEGCKTTKGKYISFCTTKEFKDSYDKTPSYLVYRYGKPNRIELEKTKDIKTILERYAGANTRSLAYFKNGAIEYLYEEAYIDADHVHGIAVYKKGKRLTFVKCDDHKSSGTEPSDLKDNALFEN
ncbi:MAG: hypothetical protein HQK84_11060 [Nitrospinae bacterium]|nr:hypothetical protein [Nitrospinota bacterium]